MLIPTSNPNVNSMLQENDENEVLLDQLVGNPVHVYNIFYRTFFLLPEIANYLQVQLDLQILKINLIFVTQSFCYIYLLDFSLG